MKSQISKAAGGAILHVPSELWELVSECCSRHALAHLCAVSQAFYAIFYPLLYGKRTTTPPLTGAQAERLIETLGAERTPHPGPLVRRLVFPSWSSSPSRPSRRIDGQACLAALRHLFSPGPLVWPSALCSLEWDLKWSGDESLAVAAWPLLRSPGCFPNLKEIIIECPDSCTRFDFLRIPNLENVGVSLTVSDHEAWRPSCDALGAELVLLPILSPLLQSLKLNLSMSAGRNDTAPPPWAAYADLLSSINKLRLPALAALELATDTAYAVSPGPASDFSLLLFAHPNLKSLTLSAPGTPMKSIPLPRLRTFTGNLAQSAGVASGAPELTSLSVQVDRDYLIEEIMTLFPLGVAPTVTQLKVSPVEGDSDVSHYPSALSPRTLHCLAGAFPNIANLDVRLERELTVYTTSLVALPNLESLCLRLWEEIPVQAWKQPAAAVFPADEYAGHISTALFPALASLVDVRLVFLGDRSPSPRGCSSCDEFNRWTAPGPLRVEYRFCVRAAEEGKRVVVLE
ncbi:hypothetical protein B0H11DRAFT_1392750 [Mycena galericulata]|nr:hypothetical protein B0H11DRAFT_1392750 [Mycena galericulata]